MSAALLAAIITAITLVTVALIGGAVTIAVQLVRWHADNRRLWLYNRELIDHIYRERPPPPPPAPPELFD